MAICAAPIKGTHLRMVAVNNCGVPITGTGALTIVSKGYIQVQMEPDYEDGEEFVERNADGELCVNQKDPSSLKRMTLTIDWCSVDPVLSSYVMSARLLDTASPAITGTGFALAEGQSLNRFSLEVWQRVAGSGACDSSGVQRFIYNAWPNVGNTQVGTYTIENGRSTLQSISETAAASTLWGNGPGAATWLPTNVNAGSADHWLWNITTTPLPVEACGPTTLT
jgi:hypothetical protein